jgi:hypothetical protein
LFTTAESCPWKNDGRCDEPYLCDYCTDSDDCGGACPTAAIPGIFDVAAPSVTTPAELNNFQTDFVAGLADSLSLDMSSVAVTDILFAEDDIALGVSAGDSVNDAIATGLFAGRRRRMQVGTTRYTVEYEITGARASSIVDQIAQVESIGSFSVPEDFTPQLLVGGCMNPDANNYDATANQDDGSCCSCLESDSMQLCADDGAWTNDYGMDCNSYGPGGANDGLCEADGVFEACPVNCYGVCEGIGGAVEGETNDSCTYSSDDYCDEPLYCDIGTDCSDCGTCYVEPCTTEENGVCDVDLGTCVAGTDCVDCPNHPSCPNLACTDTGVVLANGGTIDFTDGYDNGQACIWRITCVSDISTVVFSSFSTENNFDYVYVDDVPYSGSDIPGPVTGGTATEIRFESDGSVVDDGFSAEVACASASCSEAESCPGGFSCDYTDGDTGSCVQDAATTTIVDPCSEPAPLTNGGTIDFTGDYDNGQSCIWIASCDSGDAVITFSSFATEGGYDYVYVDDTPYHGVDIPAPVTGGVSMEIRFESDGSATEDGFMAEVTCVEAGSGRRRLRSWHNLSAPRQLQSGDWSSAADLTVQLNSIIGNTAKVDLKSRQNKLPRSNANIAPDGVPKPYVPIGAPPPPPLQERPPPATMQMLQDAGYEYNSKIGGYVFFVPVDYDDLVAQGKVEPLRNFRWIDERTQSVEVMFAVYNGNYQLFSIVQLNIKFELGGRVTKKITCSTIDLELYSNSADYMRVIVELGFVAYLVFSLVSELQLLHDIGPGKYLENYYNILDSLSIFLMFVSMLCWLQIEFIAPRVNVPDKFDFSVDCPSDGCPDGVDGVPELFTLVTDLLDTSSLYKTYRTINVVNVFLNLARIFKYFGAQKRMALINNTFATAGPDLAHFLITLITVFLGFSVTGWLVFGNLDRHWSTLFGGVFSDIPSLGAFNMVYKMSQGDIDIEGDYNMAGWLGILYYYSLTLLIIFLLVNVFLAIIMDSYKTAVEKAHGADSLFTEAAVAIKHGVNSAFGDALDDDVVSSALTMADEATTEREPDIVSDVHDIDGLSAIALCPSPPLAPLLLQCFTCFVALTVCVL